MKNQENKRKATTWFMIFGFLLILAAIVLFICFLLRGQTTVEGNWNESDSSTSLACEADSYSYPFLEYDNSTHSTTKINSSFNGDDSVSAISLKETLSYDDKQQVNKSETYNHAAMNRSFSDSGLEPDSFNITYSKVDNDLKISLYTTSKHLNNVTAKYFLLDNQNSTKYKLNEMKSNYESKGFKCTISE